MFVFEYETFKISSSETHFLLEIKGDETKPIFTINLKRPHSPTLSYESIFPYCDDGERLIECIDIFKICIDEFTTYARK
jgi:hypothetical protein